MRWSKIKQLVEGFFAKEVSGRVELWTTRYAKCPDQLGRSWITVDGEERFNMTNFFVIDDCQVLYKPERFEMEKFAGSDLSHTMREFLKLSIQAALSSANPLIRGLAALDRRVGRTRMIRLQQNEKSSFVLQLIEIRQKAAQEAKEGKSVGSKLNL